MSSIIRKDSGKPPWTTWNEPDQQSLNHKWLKRNFKDATHGLCYWCRRRVYRYTKPTGNNNTATLDHVISKLDIRRGLTDHEHNTALSCLQCNSERNEAELDRIFNEYEYWFAKEVFDIRTLV